MGTEGEEEKGEEGGGGEDTEGEGGGGVRKVLGEGAEEGGGEVQGQGEGLERQGRVVVIDGEGQQQPRTQQHDHGHQQSIRGQSSEDELHQVELGEQRHQTQGRRAGRRVEIAHQEKMRPPGGEVTGSGREKGGETETDEHESAQTKIC